MTGSWISHGEAAAVVAWNFGWGGERRRSLGGGTDGLVSAPCRGPWKILRHDGFEWIALPRRARSFLAPFSTGVRSIWYLVNGQGGDLNHFMSQCHWIAHFYSNHVPCHSHHNALPLPTRFVFHPLQRRVGVSCVKLCNKNNTCINIKTYDERWGGFALEGWFEVRGGRLRKQVVLMVMNCL